MASRLNAYLAALCCALSFWVAPLRAQEISTPPAVLVADDIQLTRDRTLIAQGNVEAFQGKTRLTATAIAYNPDDGILTITGPITIEDGEGITVLADQAELSEDLQNGLLTGARLVLNDQLQLAAVQMNRVGGRYSQLYKTAVTSCRICEDDAGPPLWQIRARRIVHDREAQQLYFDEAQLRIRDVPVLYVPRLRLPDPTLDRATGFLIPEVRSSSLLGTGLKLPYFIKLGDHRDLTLTPYLSNETRTLELRYRQAFSRGRIEIEGAVSDDELQPGDTRGYLFAVGEFQLQRDFVLQFDLELTSDDAYLSDYGYSIKDRLDSELRISRARRDEYIRFSYINFNSLRDDEDNATLPSDVINGVYERRLFPRAVGGELRFAVEVNGFRRGSNVDTDANGDGIVDGRDVARLNIDAEWFRSFHVGGLEAQTRLAVFADTFDTRQDANFDGTDSDIVPAAGLILRYPLVRQGPGAVRQFLEPMVQLAWTGGDDLDVANEESTRVEFDEGNLLSLSRFPAPDRRERGWAIAYGGTWARIDPEGWSARLTIGQITREKGQPDFTNNSGLSGTTSDYLLAGQLKFGSGLELTGRTIFDEGFDTTKAEVRGSWRNDRLDLAGSYVWLDEDPAEDLDDPINELSFDGGFRIDEFWTANLEMRYDIEEGRAATAGAGLTYENECVVVDLSVFRSFADSTSIEPSTNLGFTVSLKGLSTGEASGPTRSCGKQAR